ncbi:MAG: FAD-dependent oxidoreductase [Hyphomicrobium sp.]
MSQITRREFAGLAAGASLASAMAMPRPVLAQSAARIVIIGGGPGGTAAATRLRAANPALKITLIEPKDAYTTCFYSNLYIGGFRTFASITHTYDGLKKRGITVVSDTATAIDTAAKTVKLAKGGAPIAYDRLIVAPGIDMKFDAIAGYSPEAAEIMPHAWQGGHQTLLLKEKLLAMSAGGTVVMTVPPNPYRCPPGPYERACMIGHFLKTRKPRSKLIVFDAKKTISKQGVFEEAISEYYKDVIELNLTNEIDDFAVSKVDAATGDVTVKAGRTERAAVANIIAPQRAGAIAVAAGLTEGDWCPVDPNNFSSTKARDVYVIGDAAIAADMPKSAFAAASQGFAVAADIAADLAGSERPKGKYRNTCWSMVAPENSAKIGADYAAGLKDGKPFLEASGSFVSKPGETSALRRETFTESEDWYATFVADLYPTAGAPQR